jgi:hypothetical protein
MDEVLVSCDKLLGDKLLGYVMGVRVRCSGDLDAKRPVPFRLTPNIAEFLTQTGVTGSLTAAMVASARCFVQPHYKFASYLRAMLRDEYITWHKKVSLS